MNLKDLLAYGRGLEMSDKQAKGIEEHEKLAKVSPVKTEKKANVRKQEMLQMWRTLPSLRATLSSPERNVQALSQKGSFRYGLQK